MYIPLGIALANSKKKKKQDSITIKLKKLHLTTNEISQGLKNKYIFVLSCLWGRKRSGSENSKDTEKKKNK